MSTKTTSEYKTPFWVWISSWMISLFFILSCVGWLVASYALDASVLDDEAKKFLDELSVLDQLVRNTQVALSLVFAILLIRIQRTAFYVFSTLTLLVLLSIIGRSEWSISFLSFMTVIPVWIYLFVLYKLGLYRQVSATNKNSNNPDGYAAD